MTRAEDKPGHVVGVLGSSGQLPLLGARASSSCRSVSSTASLTKALRPWHGRCWRLASSRSPVRASVSS